MRLPAVAIASAFLMGIAIGLRLGAFRLANLRLVIFGMFGCCLLLLAISLLCILRSRLRLGALSVVAVWATLGATAAMIDLRAIPATDVLQLIDGGKVDLHSPLRWCGVLRDEPVRLPWGQSLELNLESVDVAGQSLPASGGMRFSYAAQNGDSDLADVHAGDHVALVAQAHLPQTFRDEGAFDRRRYLRAQNIELTGSLRSSRLLELIGPAEWSQNRFIAVARRHLRETLTGLLPNAPREATVLRAMLLGDRSFLERSESLPFQQTGVFHVLVVAGLHVGAFAACLFWLARRFRVSRSVASLATVFCVLAYIAVVEQRPPVLRAGLMTLVAVGAIWWFRKVELLNGLASAALVLTFFSPRLLADSSFQLSFLSLFCIGGVATPWLKRSIEPYARGMRGWRDVSLDGAHSPEVAQFRIDLRSIAGWAEPKIRWGWGSKVTAAGAGALSLIFRLAELAVLTVILQIGMLPLLARDFHRVTLSGPIANLFAVPLTSILVPFGLATLCAGSVFRSFGLVLAVPLRWMTTLLLHLVDRTASLPHMSYRIPSPPSWVMIFFFAAFLGLALFLRYESLRAKWAKRVCALASVSGALLIATFPFSPTWNRGKLELSVLDVGQGDSLFLVSPGGHTILVDGGGSFSDPYRRNETRGADPGEEAVSPYLWSRGFKQLDVVALTHAHQDHLGGLTAILNNFAVQTLWLGREVDSAQQRELEALAVAHGTRIIHQLRGGHVEWDGAKADFLWPTIVPEEVGPTAKNDDSVVFRAKFGETGFLLPGDAEKQTEHNLVLDAKPELLRADVLKIGHHGSKNSTTPEFLEAVHPKLAVISAGEENPYGHPSPQLLERLRQAGVPYLRTDRNGAIHILSDGRNLSVKCFVPCEGMDAEIRSGMAQAPDQQQREQK